MVFTDGSFANNKDLSSQIGFLVMLVNEKQESSEDVPSFNINGNLIHWSSTKCKRVTRSVLASEIYGMTDGFDISLAIATTLRMITDRLNLPPIPLIVCVDSYSLYECIVKLGTTKEKRLMIDIMALRQSYERREILEVRWINGNDNPADAMTKASPNKALERFISTNQLTIRVEGSVHRPV
ncbi:polyprotein [Hirsutella rhossiliensis]|uniref:Polyprotein n=1 Tax=Hirsutella rhossiliensis TaxID=111463 RepID=A0A9P8SFQ6_9HYPO|nr:polyprotein [Hirsutella rhossiliensis]KAH0959256.1 polyprotein [Hirsutella rhossiliensis]